MGKFQDNGKRSAPTKGVRHVGWLLVGFWLTTSQCLGAQAIQRAFGQTLGQRFELAASIDGGMSRDEMWFGVKVDRPLPFLSRFRVLVTPLGLRVYGILADDTAVDLPGCIQHARVLAAMVAGKYRTDMPGARMVQTDDEHVFRLEQAPQRRRITIACDTAGRLSMLYDDLALREQAAAEQPTWNQLVDDAQSGRAEVALPRLQKLADQGHSQAQLLVALAYRRGRGVVPDDERAEAFYLKAAQVGLLDAQYNLGTFYLQRNDFSKALPWLRAAAERGKVAAQNNLAQLLLRPGPHFDEAEALHWFLRAADNGHIEAQYNSCHMYSAGDGIARSEIDAYKWCDIAAAAGHQKARDNRDFIAQRMGAQEVERAKLLSRQWQASHPAAEHRP
jgi:hypothetical protein